MISRKIERAKYGPSMLEVFLGALLSLLLGAVLAVAYLIVEPVEVGTPQTKDEPAGPVTYVKGAQDLDHGKQWLRKKQLFTEGVSVEVNEDELNSWITAGTTPEPPKAADAKKPVPAAAHPAAHPAVHPTAHAAAHPVPPAGAPATPPATPPAPGGFIQFGTPNFRIADGVLQIGNEGELDVDMLGIKRPLILQASGRFVKQAGGFAFVPDQLYVGSCPMHKLPGVAEFLLARVLANEKIPEDIAAAWKKLAAVSIEGRSLRLTMP